MAKEQEDLRATILAKRIVKFPEDEAGEMTDESIKRNVYAAMDKYMETCVLEAFSFLAKHFVDCEVTKEGKEVFLYKGEMISREQLFENFL